MISLIFKDSVFFFTILALFIVVVFFFFHRRNKRIFLSELSKIQKELQGQYQIELDFIRMDERMLFSENLHNNFGSTIAAVLNFVRIESLNTNGQERKLELQELEIFLEKSYDSIRSLSHCLHTESSIHTFWLKIIKEKMNLFPSIEIIQELKVDTLPDDDILDAEVQEFVSFAINEFLTNTIKHSPIQKVNLCIHLEKEKFTLSVQNYGIKRVKKTSISKGIGLKLIHEKAETLHGNMEFGLNVQGFFIHLSLPYFEI